MSLVNSENCQNTEAFDDSKHTQMNEFQATPEEWVMSLMKVTPHHLVSWESETLHAGSNHHGTGPSAGRRTPNAKAWNVISLHFS